MADHTSHDESLTRDAAASRLLDLARELEGDGPAKVQVGNKVVTLSPPGDLDYAIDVQERSPMLGGQREEITITLEWRGEEAES